MKPKEVGGPRLSADFLEYIFDVQMELGSGSEEEQAKIEQEVLTMRQQRLDTMKADFLAFEQNQEHSLDGVEVILAELKYLENILGM